MKEIRSYKIYIDLVETIMNEGKGYPTYISAEAAYKDSKLKKMNEDMILFLQDNGCNMYGESEEIQEDIRQYIERNLGINMSVMVQRVFRNKFRKSLERLVQLAQIENNDIYYHYIDKMCAGDVSLMWELLAKEKYSKITKKEFERINEVFHLSHIISELQVYLQSC